MNLGKFSICLNVSNIEQSLVFYHKLGFRVKDGGHKSEGFPDNESQRWRVIINGSAKIGLFQGMFEQNMINFHCDDIGPIREALAAAGLVEQVKPDAPDFNTVFLTDPDDNPIMIEPHSE